MRFWIVVSFLYCYGGILLVDGNLQLTLEPLRRGGKTTQDYDQDNNKQLTHLSSHSHAHSHSQPNDSHAVVQQSYPSIVGDEVVHRRLTGTQVTECVCGEGIVVFIEGLITLYYMYILFIAS